MVSLRKAISSFRSHNLVDTGVYDDSNRGATELVPLIERTDTAPRHFFHEESLSLDFNSDCSRQEEKETLSELSTFPISLETTHFEQPTVGVLEPYDVCFVLPIYDPDFPLLDRSPRTTTSLPTDRHQPLASLESPSAGRELTREQLSRWVREICFSNRVLHWGGIAWGSPKSLPMSTTTEAGDPQQRARALCWNGSSPGAGLVEKSTDSPAQRKISSGNGSASIISPRQQRQLRAAQLMPAGITELQFYSSMQSSFLCFLDCLGCLLKLDIRGDLLFFRVRLSQEAAKHLAHRRRYQLQIDPSVGERLFPKGGEYLAPYMEYYIDAEEKYLERFLYPSSRPITGPIDAQNTHQRAEFTPRQPAPANILRNTNRHPEAEPPRGPQGSIASRPLILWQRYDILGRKVEASSLPAGAIWENQYSIFRPIDRMRLLMQCIARYYDVDALSRRRIIWTHFSLHQPVLKSRLFKAWGNWSNMKQLEMQPLDEIREYFGESVAFYFAWMGVMTRSLLRPSIIGLIVFAIQLFWDPRSRFESFGANILSIAYSMYITCWASRYLASWDRTEKELSVRWGVEHLLWHAKQERFKYQPPKWKSFKGFLQLVRVSCSVLASLMFVGFALAVVSVIFSIPYWVHRHPDKFNLIRNCVPQFVSFVNVSFIAACDLIWCKLAYLLTDFENWKYEAEYERSVTVKLFVFRFINYFNSFFYLAFYKELVDPCPPYGTCVGLLRWNLAVIFLVNFGFNILEVGIPAVAYYWHRRQKRLRSQHKTRDEAAYTRRDKYFDPEALVERRKTVKRHEQDQSKSGLQPTCDQDRLSRHGDTVSSEASCGEAPQPPQHTIYFKAEQIGAKAGNEDMTEGTSSQPQGCPVTRGTSVAETTITDLSSEVDFRVMETRKWKRILSTAYRGARSGSTGSKLLGGSGTSRLDGASPNESCTVPHTTVTPRRDELIDSPTAAETAEDQSFTRVPGTSDPDWEREFAMTNYETVYGIVEDYLEIVLQFGFVILFSIILPLIPFLAYVSNLFEIRSDAFKLLKLHRRVFPVASSGIGPWRSLLMAMCYMAVSVNIAMSVFTMGLTRQLEFSFTQKLITFVIAEHVLILMSLVLNFLIPVDTRRVEIMKQQMHTTLQEAIWGDPDTEELDAYGLIPKAIQEQLLRRPIRKRRASNFV